MVTAVAVGWVRRVLLSAVLALTVRQHDGCDSYEAPGHGPPDQTTAGPCRAAASSIVWNSNDECHGDDPRGGAPSGSAGTVSACLGASRKSRRRGRSGCCFGVGHGSRAGVSQLLSQALSSLSLGMTPIAGSSAMSFAGEVSRSEPSGRK